MARSARLERASVDLREPCSVLLSYERTKGPVRKGRPRPLRGSLLGSKANRPQLNESTYCGRHIPKAHDMGAYACAFVNRPGAGISGRFRSFAVCSRDCDRLNAVLGCLVPLPIAAEIDGRFVSHRQGRYPLDLLAVGEAAANRYGLA